MSIYRKFDREPLSDVHAKAVKRPGDDARGSAQSRKAQPAGEPLPATIQWAAKLPPDVRPMSLLRQFPRIANALASSWGDPALLRPYLDELFVDRRGNRQGFPPEVMAELFSLRAFYEDLHPTHERRWDDSQKHR